MNRIKFQTAVISKLALKNGKLDEHDFAEMATGLIEDVPGAVALDDDDRRMLARVFGPRRDLQRANIDTLLEKHGLTLDADTDETLELLLNPGVFIHQMSQIDDPQTGKPLVQKEVKTLKKKKMKALFGTAPTAVVSETTNETSETPADDDAQPKSMEPTPPPAPLKAPLKPVAKK